MDLVQRSLDLLRSNQASSGAFLACPNFPIYRYGWFRDGAFCAYALDLYHEPDSAQRFYAWTIDVVRRYENKIRQGIDLAQKGIAPDTSATLHARFTLEGTEVPGHWGNHQLDGLGAWLWAMRQHFLLNPDLALPPAWREALCLVRDYLVALWPFPCSDSWEEHEDQRHTYTLAAVSAGLRGLAEWLGDEAAGKSAAEMRAFLLANGVADGRFVKSIGGTAIDANLVGLAYPYELTPMIDARMRRTLEQIEAHLKGRSGGLRRYPTDTYYGGGEWPILYAWLGWVYARAGQVERAESILKWIEQQANPSGELPEQVQETLNAPEYYPVWVERWGPVASPLLWSHAMYLILRRAIDTARLASGG